MTPHSTLSIYLKHFPCIFFARAFITTDYDSVNSSSINHEKVPIEQFDKTFSCSHRTSVFKRDRNLFSFLSPFFSNHSKFSQFSITNACVIDHDISVLNELTINTINRPFSLASSLLWNKKAALTWSMPISNYTNELAPGDCYSCDEQISYAVNRSFGIGGFLFKKRHRSTVRSIL